MLQVINWILLLGLTSIFVLLVLAACVLVVCAVREIFFL